MAQIPPPSREWRQKHHQPKPPRLRSACNQCNSAKVKCTGELKGCARCNSLHTECVYEESRVGKVQSSRSKRRKLGGQQDTAGTSTEINVSPGTIQVVAARTTPRLSQDEHVPRPVIDTSASSGWSESENWAPMAAWEYDMPMLDNALLSMENFDAAHDTVIDSTDHGEFEEDTVEGGEVSTRGSSLGSAEANDAQPQDLDSRVRPAEHAVSNSTRVASTTSSGGSHSSHEHDKASIHDSITWASPGNTRQMTGPPLPTPTSSSIVSLSPRTGLHLQAQPLQREEKERPPEPQPPGRDFSKLDSKCVLACANILATLENYLLSDLKTLDLVLAAVRKASDDLKQLVQLQQESRCDRCIILFTAIMFQIIGLLEAGTTPLPDTETGLPGGILSGIQTSFVPALGFGAFSLTSEEQRSWRSQIVLREYRHVGEILSAVTELAKLGPRGAPTSPEMVEHRTGCLKNLARKLKSFAEREGGIS